MKLYNAKIPLVAREIVQLLIKDEDIEVNKPEEAELDVQAVLREYLRMDREVTERAKDLLENRKLPYEQFGKIKRALAEERNFSIGDEGVSWICNQVIEAFMHSNYVEEVFSEDADLKRKIRPIIIRHMQIEDELDAEVRKRIKNLQEGTANWDVEYAKVMSQIKINKGLRD